MIEWKSLKEDGFPKNKGKYLTCGNRSIFGDYVSYDVLGFSLDLNSIDEYDFPKEKYKNKPGFFYYDSEYGFGEYTHVLFWAPINSPDEKIVDEGREKCGEWQITDAYPHIVYCSKCHERFAQTHWAVWEDGTLPRNFCPNCGADMRRKEK